MKAGPAVLEGAVGPKSRQSFKIKLSADPTQVPAGVQMAPMDITLDGKRCGGWFDFAIQARERAVPSIVAQRLHHDLAERDVVR